MRKYSINFCIPTIGRDELKKSLKSVLSLNTLNKIDYKIIVSDDSKDSLSLPILESIKGSYKSLGNRLKYVKNKKRGQFNNMNNLIHYVDSEWIVFLHDDDYLDSYYLKYILPHLSYKDIDIVYSGRKLINSDFHVLGTGLTSLKEDFVKFDAFNYFKTYLFRANTSKFIQMPMISGLCIKSNIVNEVGGFDTDLYVNADSLFLNKAFVVSKKAVYINKPLVTYTIQDQSERSRPSKDGTVYYESKKIYVKTIKFLSNKSLISKKDLYEYKKSFYKQMINLNGPILWIALRFTGTYFARLKKQSEILQDILNEYPPLKKSFKLYLTVFVSLFPNFLLGEFYNIYIKYFYNKKI